MGPRSAQEAPRGAQEGQQKLQQAKKFIFKKSGFRTRLSSLLRPPKTAPRGQKAAKERPQKLPDMEKIAPKTDPKIIVFCTNFGAYFCICQLLCYIKQFLKIVYMNIHKYVQICENIRKCLKQLHLEPFLGDPPEMQRGAGGPPCRGLPP